MKENEKEEEKKEEKPIEEEKIKEYLKKWKGWQISDDKNKIFKVFRFKDFREITDFVYEILRFGEKINYFPLKIIIEFPKIRVELSNEKIKGITEKDFILAKEIEALTEWKIKFYQWLGSPKIFAILVIIFFLIVSWHYLGYIKELLFSLFK